MQDEEVLGKAYDARLMRRLIGYLRPYRRQVLFAFLLIVLDAALETIPPLLTMLAIDRYIAAADAGGLVLVAGAYAPTLGVKFGVEFIQALTLQATGQRIMFDMRMQIFSHLQSLSPSFYDRNPVGRLITRVVTDVDTLNELFSSGLVSVFGDIFTLLGIVIAMLLLDWRLALVTMSVIPLIGLATAVFRAKARDSYRRVRIAIAKINAFLNEHITCMSIVQLYNREKKSAARFARINEEHRMANMDSVLAYSWFYPVIELLSSIALGLIIWYGGGRMIQGAIELGALVAFIQYSERFFRPIADLSEKYNILQSAMASSERVFTLLDTRVEVGNPENSVRPASAPAGDIEFRNVWFAYNDENWVLRDVSFRVNPGES